MLIPQLVHVQTMTAHISHSARDLTFLLTTQVTNSLHNTTTSSDQQWNYYDAVHMCSTQRA